MRGFSIRNAAAAEKFISSKATNAVTMAAMVEIKKDLVIDELHDLVGFSPYSRGKDRLANMAAMVAPKKPYRALPGT